MERDCWLGSANITSPVCRPSCVQDEALRWGCVYAAAAYQAALSLPALPPTALGLLSRGEAALYAASPNPPFLVLTRLRQLVQRAELSSQVSAAPSSVPSPQTFACDN